MIVGIGIDIVEVSRIREIHARHAERFVNRKHEPHQQV